MPLPITVPRLGWSMDEGTFLGWLKNDGESVEAGEPLFTLEGDKAAQEVEATDSGILRIPAEAPKAGDVVKVGALLGYLEEGQEAGARGQEAGKEFTRDLPPAPCPPSPAPRPSHLQPRLTPDPSPRSRAPAISPRARRRAAELGVDCRHIKGSGRSGRIIEADVLAAVREPPASGASTMRRTIARRTAESFARAPHFYLRTEVDVTALLELRERLRPEIERATGVRLTLTDLLLRAQALALRDCPHANAIWQGDGIVRFATCDVGLVVGLAGGLRVPIVRGADRGVLSALVRQRASLVEAARAGTLTAEAMQGGATSLSNLGSGGVDEFAAVISPPQSSMLAVGRAAPRPYVVEGRLAVRTTLRLCLSADHRVLDGGSAAEYLGRLTVRLEEPGSLV